MLAKPRDRAFRVAGVVYRYECLTVSRHHTHHSDELSTKRSHNLCNSTVIQGIEFHCEPLPATASIPRGMLQRAVVTMCGDTINFHTGQVLPFLKSSRRLCAPWAQNGMAARWSRVRRQGCRWWLGLLHLNVWNATVLTINRKHAGRGVTSAMHGSAFGMKICMSTGASRRFSLELQKHFTTQPISPRGAALTDAGEVLDAAVDALGSFRVHCRRGSVRPVGCRGRRKRRDFFIVCAAKR